MTCNRCSGTGRHASPRDAHRCYGCDGRGTMRNASRTTTTTDLRPDAIRRWSERRQAAARAAQARRIEREMSRQRAWREMREQVHLEVTAVAHRARQRLAGLVRRALGTQQTAMDRLSPDALGREVPRKSRVYGEPQRFGDFSMDEAEQMFRAAQTRAVETMSDADRAPFTASQEHIARQQERTASIEAPDTSWERADANIEIRVPSRARTQQTETPKPKSRRR
jgi:hypothetical protein